MRFLKVIPDKNRSQDAVFCKAIQRTDGGFDYIKLNSRFPVLCSIESKIIDVQIRKGYIKKIEPSDVSKSDAEYIFKTYGVPVDENGNQDRQWLIALQDFGFIPKPEPKPRARPVIPSAAVEEEEDIVEEEVKPVTTMSSRRGRSQV